MELRPYQRECLNEIENRPPGRYLVVLPTGSGKCLAKGTKVLMYDGSIINVEDIREGDLLMGPDSKQRMAVNLTHGFDEMYKITPTKGESYIVNSEHILSLKITNMNKDRLKLPDGSYCASGDIVNISIKDYLSATKTFRHCAKGWRTGVEFEEADVSIPPYILGIWLCDGSRRGTQITTMEPEVLRELERYANKNNLIVHKVYSENTGKATTYSIVANTYNHGANVFRKGLKDYNLHDEKHIPKCYLINSRKNRLELLAGLIDADGYLYNNVFEIATVSLKMSEQIVYLVRSLGFFAHKKEKIVNGKTYYRITISGDLSEIPTMVKRRICEQRAQKKSVLVTGISVENIGVGEYFGFELVGNDRLFLLGDFTVTHNTVIFSHIPRNGRMLIISHREELVNQPLKYFECSTGIERAKYHSNGEEVISASVQTLVKRLDSFSPTDFEYVIVDEGHHSIGRTYRDILNYFNPQKVIAFTATPNRLDNVGLYNIYSEIIYQKDLRWMIEHGYLCDLYCLRVNIGYDLSRVSIRNGDYAPGELDEAMQGTADAIAQAYMEHAKGPTIIFAASVRHAEDIAKKIPGAAVVTGQTKDRGNVVEAFTRGDIKVLVNCMVFTEGTDIPCIETVIVARPTASDALYTQMVGRAMRLYQGKERAILIDCVGVTGTRSLCTAPSLLGLNLDGIPESRTNQVQGMLFDLPALAESASDCPESWIKNVQVVNIWAKEQGLNTRDIAFFKQPDGRLTVALKGRKITIPAPDMLGYIPCKDGSKMPLQAAIDLVFTELKEHYADQDKLWNRKKMSKWRREPASDKQKQLIGRLCKGWKKEDLTKGEAALILNRLL